MKLLEKQHPFLALIQIFHKMLLVRFKGLFRLGKCDVKSF
jgi:hypothetical protein